MPIDPGQLRQRVTIQENSPTQDGYGEPIASWSTLATVWAAIAPLDGRERLQAEQVESDMSHRVTIRYRSAVTEKMRLSYGTRTLYIESVVVPDERNAVMVLECREARS